MRRYTTPTHRFVLPDDIDTAQIDAVMLAYAQGGSVVLRKFLPDMEREEHAYVTQLTAAETACFRPHIPIAAQLTLVIGDFRIKSDIMTIPLARDAVEEDFL